MNGTILIFVHDPLLLLESRFGWCEVKAKNFTANSVCGNERALGWLRLSALSKVGSILCSRNGTSSPFYRQRKQFVCVVPRINRRYLRERTHKCNENPLYLRKPVVHLIYYPKQMVELEILFLKSESPIAPTKWPLLQQHLPYSTIRPSFDG